MAIRDEACSGPGPLLRRRVLSTGEKTEAQRDQKSSHITMSTGQSLAQPQGVGGPQTLVPQLPPVLTFPVRLLLAEPLLPLLFHWLTWEGGSQPISPTQSLLFTDKS